VTDNLPAASALIEALARLKQVEAAINAALDQIGTTSPPPVTRVSAAVRTTGTQIIAVLAAAAEPLTLIDIADGVLAIRRGEDEPRQRGGTRYQEMCRSSLARLIDRGLVERVDPSGRHELMRFRRTSKRRETQ
jgi:hypothetical protein